MLPDSTPFLAAKIAALAFVELGPSCGERGRTKHRLGNFLDPESGNAHLRDSRARDYTSVILQEHGARFVTHARGLLRRPTPASRY